MKTLILTLFIILVASAAPELPTLEEVDYVITEIKYCIFIHQWWIDNENAVPTYQRKIAGTVEWHERWIDTYNKTLEILQAYRYLLIKIGLEPPQPPYQYPNWTPPR